MRLYLGLDSSTQSLTALVIAVDGEAREVVFERSLVFDRDLPAYGTGHGVLPSTDPRIVHAPPLMWAEALDVMLGEIAASGLDPSKLAAISGSAQQHGSVYLNARAASRLAALDPATPMTAQLEDSFARATAPVWMDSSTSEECDEITRSLGGPARLAALTGSRAFERFTGPQIRCYYKRDPDGYAAAAQIHLVSSFMATLLVGTHAPLDPGDASGMNLMDLQGQWAQEALDATAPDLRRRLPAIVAPTTIVGSLSRYWQVRHGLPAANVVVWSGDNPSSLIGTGLAAEGQVAISLGTSDTIFGPMQTARPDPSGTGHVFGSPAGGFMGLTCIRNGSLARERVRDRYGLNWLSFSRALATTPPGNHGALMLPWFEPEITPPVLVPRVHRRNLDDADMPANVRAVIEAQMMSLANHSQWMAVNVRTIHATGGGSTNRHLLQVMADVFGADVYQFAVTNAACLGAALRAWHADEMARGRAVAWPEIMRGLAEPIAASRMAPDLEITRTYASLREQYASFEAERSGQDAASR
jgi:xylulokinase